MADVNLSVFDTNASTRAQKFSLKQDFKILAIFGLFFAGLVAIEVVMSLSPLFTGAGLIAIPAWMFYKNRQFNRTQKAIFNGLAADNNWTLDQPTPADASKAGPTVNLPISPVSRLAGSLNGLPFWLCTDAQATYLLIDAQRSLPRAIFMASVYDSGPLRIVFNQFLKAESLAPVKLEGDFDKYFRLYVEPAATIDVLSIVAPDFMASLIEAGLVSSVMFADHFCFIKAYAEDPKNLRALLMSGQAITKQLSD